MIVGDLKTPEKADAIAGGKIDHPKIGSRSAIPTAGSLGSQNENITEHGIHSPTRTINFANGNKMYFYHRGHRESIFRLFLCELCALCGW